MSLAALSAQQTSLLSAAQQAAASGGTSASSTGTSSTTGTASSTSADAQAGSAALNSLSGNFGSFLNLLMTQLKNQDPTAPMDTNEFTTELVQFSGVEQQINTNSSLTQLIQLTQGNEMLQATQMVGKTVDATSTQIPLQNGTGSLQYTGTQGQQVAISITNSAGADVKDALLTANQGANTWTWDGTDNSGNTLPDGAYNVAVVGGSSTGTATTALPFSVAGTVTGAQQASSGNGVTVDLGSVGVSLSAVTSVASSSGGGASAAN